MINVKHISSPENSKFKNWNKLIQRKYRDREGLFLIEGELLIKDAIGSGGIIKELIVSSYEEEPSLAIQGILDFISETRAFPEVYMLSGELFEKLSQTEHGRLIIGVFEKPKDDASKLSFSRKAGISEESKERANPKTDNVLVLDGIQDPGNMGTLIRTADAAGFGLVIILKGSVDPFSPKVVRAAAGSLMRLPIIKAKDVKELEGILRRNYFFDEGRKLKIIATGLSSDKSLWDLEIKNESEGYAIVIGNEGNGVSKELLEMADEVIKIPMFGEIESLNAGVSGAIVMYEIIRQQNSLR